MIRKRILEEDWDDVVPRELVDVAGRGRNGDDVEVSQERSRMGLGELYEREYAARAGGDDPDKAEAETAEEKARNEMRRLFGNLCSKLDALSNYHFAPRPQEEEEEGVRPTDAPALALEDAVPMDMSRARAVAPGEV
mmetsp:Transcript_37247/g.73128  ORF Transcript_37247/g.73128 Transcript_37247/m.73128 type:complete len:137 (+) Transcript_37247:661-1071(+)